MAEVVIRYLTCDRCKSKHDTSASLTTINVPARLYDCEGKTYTKGYAPIMLCPICSDKLWSLVNEKFVKVYKLGTETRASAVLDQSELADTNKLPDDFSG